MTDAVGGLQRRRIPKPGGATYLSDGGLETFLIFERGIELPEFASFVLLDSDAGRAELRAYYERYLALAAGSGLGFVLEAPTWRASERWGARLGYDAERLDEANRAAIGLLDELRDGAGAGPVAISGCIGPEDDAYAPDQLLSAEQAREYHAPQVASFAKAGADLVGAMTIAYADEAIGVARAAAEAGLPAMVSFTVETDGRLPSGQALGEAIEEVDADPGTDVAYFGINCAHPTHFRAELRPGEPWIERIAALRANASRRSHAELDEATELDPGDPVELGHEYAELRPLLPKLSVLGGCCGTDYRHIEAIRSAVLA